MKSKRLLLTAGAILAGLALLASSCTTASPSPTSVPDGARSLSAVYPGQQTGIWVSGEGKVKVVPDIALLQLGVEARESTVAQAQEKASRAMDAVMAALTSRGVASKDIRTQGFSIQPVTRFLDTERREEIIGYHVSNMVMARIRKLADAGAIIDAVAAAGGDSTRISSISFTVDDPAPLRTEARELAIKDAVAKAKQMAGVAGVKLGKLVYMTESGGFIPVPQPVFFKGAEAGGAVPATVISPGETEINVSVQLVYALD